MSPSARAAVRPGGAAAQPRFAPPAPVPRLESARQPLYLALARTLLQGIEKGRYPIGSALPPEDALARHHGVSRHTVRQALRELKDEGVVWARAGIGTIVRSHPQAPRFFSGIRTVWDLLQFVESTEMHVVKRRAVVADAGLAQLLHCPPGQAWHEITILRKLPQEQLPLSYLQVYLRPEFVEAAGPEKIFTRPIYSMVEERFGLRIVEVHQEITAANLGPAMARALKAKEGLAAMRITRSYLDRDGTVVEVGVGYYPSGRYTQRSRFRAQSADGAGAGHG